MFWIVPPLVLVVSVASAAAQPPRVTHVEGEVFVERDGLRTTGGRAELVLAAGSLIHLDAASTLQFSGASAFTLADGRVLLRTTSATDVHLPYALLRAAPDGVFDVLVDASRGRLLVSALGGEAELQTRYGQTARITRQQGVMMSGATASPWATRMALVPWDAFSGWSQTRLAFGAAAVRAPEWPSLADSHTIQPYVGASLPCASWLGRDHPCWLTNAPSFGPVLPPGVSPYTPIVPNYAPRYAPSYGPPAALRPSPEPPAAEPVRGQRHPRPPPPPRSTRPAPPLSPPASETPGGSGGIRVPERPDSR